MESMRVEERKVAMARGRGVALLRGLVHFVPVSVCVVLFSFNSSSFFIGSELGGLKGQDVQKFASIQFAAKIHELAMLASLGLIIATHVRRDLGVGEGLPFGAVFLPSGFQQINFLWSQAVAGAAQRETGGSSAACGLLPRITPT
ncbi:hypothetical protein B0H67DRAFT_642443 [Lasiosphaeris hirsuta]|uniref:Uncharacterized protein n=1 Tax=Lasiosphaeris hirsuta TaxID=260670 RepID=A0AA40E5T2_9PEZI|nr:hypothetical protein B0H67DRAFT_642443 [Lasiosphaeris hirsuta]